jgi:hypothetical protein
MQFEMMADQEVPDLHDGMLLGILLTDAGGAELFCRSVAGDRVVLRMEAVQWLRADDFRQGNVILEVRLDVGQAIDRQAVAEALGEERESSSVQAVLTRAHVEDWRYLELNSSYGCQLSTLFSGSLSVSEAAGAS